MKNFVFVLFFVSFFGTAQSFQVASIFDVTEEPALIKGTVLDAENNNEPLAFSEVTIPEMGATTHTDMNGNFTVTLQPGTYTLEIGFIGYSSKKIDNIAVDFNQTLEKTIVLSASSNSVQVSSLEK